MIIVSGIPRIDFWFAIVTALHSLPIEGIVVPCVVRDVRVRMIEISSEHEPKQEVVGWNGTPQANQRSNDRSIP
jgi:hypothetical protein